MVTQKHWRQGGIEPEVEELLTDPIVALVLRRDRITVDDVRDAIRAAGSEQLQSREAGPPAREARPA